MTTTTTTTNSRKSRFSTTSALLFSLAGLLSISPTTASIEPLPRIVGGQNASPGEYRFFVSWDSSCGATVISDNLLLTAAHCGPVVSNSTVLGAYTRGTAHEPQPVKSVARRIDKRIVHPDYNAKSWEMDIMILKIHGSVPNWIPRVRLNQDDALPAEGDAVTVIGMGWLDEDKELGFPTVLQEVNVSVTEYETCNSQEMYNGFIDDPSMICAAVPNGGKDACFGDSGGPLLQEMGDGNWTQVGVVSFGVGCARANRPGVYSRVSMAYDWIQDIICAESKNKPDHCPQVTRTFTEFSAANSSSSTPAITGSPSSSPTTAAPTSQPTAAPTSAPSAVPSSSPTSGLRARDFTRDKSRNFKSKARARSLPLPQEFP